MKLEPSLITSICDGFKSGRFRVLSLDIFDTLLLRTYHSEAYRFYQMSKIIEQDYFSKYRGYAEDLFRARCFAHHYGYKMAFLSGQREPSIGKIHALQRIFLANTSLNEEIQREAELRVEREHTKPNSVLVSLVNSIRASTPNALFVLLSDMYLTQDYLFDLLASHAIPNCDHLYVSCETGHAKSTGAAYRNLIAKTGIPAEKIVHFGDNYRSDIIQAHNNGLTAVHTPRGKLFCQAKRIIKKLDYQFITGEFIHGI